MQLVGPHPKTGETPETPWCAWRSAWAIGWRGTIDESFCPVCAAERNRQDGPGTTAEFIEADINPEDFDPHHCPECHQDDRTAAILYQLIQEIVPNDSYGVHGSDFRTCMLCGTGGSPTAKFEHNPECSVKEADEFVYAYGKYIGRATDE